MSLLIGSGERFLATGLDSDASLSASPSIFTAAKLNDMRLCKVTVLLLLLSALFSHMEIESHCPICKDLYEDAVLARDGFAYCRACIVQWAGRGERRWKSPRTNEYFEGHPILRRDVERDSAAKVLRKQELLAAMQGDMDVLDALDASHCGVPLLEKVDCERLLWHSTVQMLPYVHLSVALRAGALAELRTDVLQEVCRLDRRAVCVPLLEMAVVVTLVREVVRRCEEGRESLPLLQELKTHLAWRNEVRDAVDVPLTRTNLEGLAGLYHRSWRPSDGTSVLFVKGDGIVATRRYLDVPLLNGSSRGACETPIKTKLHADASFIMDAECMAPATYSSEVPLRPDALHWRTRRGALPFPDTRGDHETDDEDWSEHVILGCAGLFEEQLRHLPFGFEYHRRSLTEDHRYELLAEMNLINEALLKASAAEASASRGPKRKR